MDESVGATLSELLRRTAKHWALWVSGASAGVAGFVLPAAGITVVPGAVLLWIGVALVLVAFVSAFHDVRLERDGFRERLKPRFGVSTTRAACSQPDDNGYLKRIVVSNDGAKTVSEVKVKLVNLRPDPAGLTAKMPLPLQPQHMKGATPEYDFALSPGEERPVDVFSIRYKKPGVMFLKHTVEWVQHEIPEQTYHADISIVGNDVLPITRVLKISVEDGVPSLTLVS